MSLYALRFTNDTGELSTTADILDGLGLPGYCRAPNLRLYHLSFEKDGGREEEISDGKALALPSMHQLRSYKTRMRSASARL